MGLASAISTKIAADVSGFDYSRRFLDFLKSADCSIFL